MTRRRCRQGVLATLAVVATMACPASASAASSVYASLNGADAVAAFGIGTAGALAPLPAPSAPTGAQPAGLALSPDGASLYVVNQATQSLSQFDVGADGALTPKAVATAATGPAPFAIAVAPDGRHAYVVNQGDGTVTVLTADAGGALTVTSTATVGAGAVGLAVAPDGRHAYVADYAAGTVSQLAVAADGSLSPLTPATVAAGVSPFDVALSLDGASVYVTDQIGAGRVLQYDRAADGTLAPKAVPSVGAGRLPAGLAVGGRGVYVASFGSAGVAQFDVGADGSLTAKAAGPVAAGASPWGVTLGPDGASLYVANYGAASISQYDVGADGALTAKAPATVDTGARPVDVVATVLPDRTAPTVELLAPEDGDELEQGESLTADYACADDRALVSCEGTVPDGAPIDTSVVGDFRFTVVARDAAGHETSVTHAYRVVAPTPDPDLGWAGFRGPIRGLPTVNVRTAGSAVPIRFALDGYRGLDVLQEGSPTSVRVSCRKPGRPTKGDPARSVDDRGLRFRDDRYRFEWQTRKGWAGQCRVLVLRFTDGTVQRALVRLRAPSKR